MEKKFIDWYAFVIRELFSSLKTKLYWPVQLFIKRA